MRSFRELVWSILLLATAFLISPSISSAQQSSATLRGQVADSLGGLVVAATVTVADANGVEKSATTDDQGRYTFTSLAPGLYTVRASAPGFATYENAAVDIRAGRTEPLNITLAVAIEEQTVTVTEEAPINTEPENNAGAVVLRGADLDSLPDDPDELADALQALAGPSSGSAGSGDIFIDGFSGGRLPPKDSIREIRINRNPFSAEYDRLGFGRIEIFTKPGTDRFRGQAFFNFNDESLNARDPFAPSRASFQRRRYGGNISGPLSAKRASYFLDFERNETNDNNSINAIILDPALNITPFSQVVLQPRRNTEINPRIDWQLNKTNTLVARYSYERNNSLNTGVGDLSLLSRAFNTTDTSQTLQLTETSVINQKIINETRFQYIRDRTRQVGDNSLPSINVLDAFMGGGSQIGLSLNNVDRFELQNYTSWSIGKHALKAGLRIRHVKLTDVSPRNFAGTYTFAGGLAPQLDANNNIVIDPTTGLPATINITSIERYRRTLLFQGQGLNAAQIRALGGGATQFSISGGNPEADVTQTDVSPFIQDDWRVRPNLTLSLGLRYETQTNISDHMDFAPRFAFAWSPGGGGNQRQQKTVIRGGFGIFYDRFSENLTLQADRFNGTNQQQFVVTSTTTNGQNVLDLFPTSPSLATLTGFAIPQTTRVVAPNLQAPYTMQAALSVERQLPYNVTLSVNFITARTLHVLRSRNINAPLLDATGRPLRDGLGNLVRPLGNVGNVFQYESSGRFNQNQLVVSLNNRLSRKFTLFATYTLNKADSDTDGANSFPINQYDASTEYGRSSQDIRHRLFLGGSINALPWGIRLNPLVTINSGRPFNITTGRDLNGDTLFTDRPAFATDLTRPGVILTRFGAFDPNPTADEIIIPRNYGTGPSFFTVNLRASKTFSFGEVANNTAAGQGAGGAGGGGRGGRGGGGGGGRGGGGRGGFGGGGQGGDFGGSSGEGRYNLTFSINAANLFNHPNLGIPVGNLSSPLFGQSVNSAGRFGFGSGGGGGQNASSRRIELQLRFSF